VTLDTFAVVLLIIMPAGRPPTVDYAAVVATVQATNSVNAAATQHSITPQRVWQILAQQGVPPPVGHGGDPLATALGLPARPKMPVQMLALMLIAEVTLKGHTVGYSRLYDTIQAKSPAFHVSRRHVSYVMFLLWPLQYIQRMGLAIRRLLRGKYRAPYPGYSLHIDANSKLQEYGLHVGGSQDGHSRRILSLVCLTDLLAITVYTEVFLAAVMVYGFLPDATISDKGSENLIFSFVCHHLRILHTLSNGVAQHLQRAAHRFVPSTRNKIERFWHEVNLRVNLPLKLIFLDMENRLQILDVGQAHHIGAIQALCKPLMQFALDELKDSWNVHRVNARHNAGRPNFLWHRTSHPGGNPTVPNGYDGAAEYESANQVAVTRQPAWVAQRDPLFHQSPAKRAARQQAVLTIWNAGGGVPGVWADILHQGGAMLFIPSYREYLRHV
tara:strand:- start:1489 stop:2814 length:1326 start_codon:yes stop_codon:yes gene_type:complete